MDREASRLDRIAHDKAESKRLVSELKKQRKTLFWTMITYIAILAFYAVLLLFLAGACIYILHGIDLLVLAVLVITVPLAYVVLIKEFVRIVILFNECRKDYIRCIPWGLPRPSYRRRRRRRRIR